METTTVRENWILLPVLLAVTVLKLFGQTTVPTVDPGVQSLVSNLGVIGVLVWYLWHNTTKTLPSMQEKFLADQAAARAVFAQEQADARAADSAEKAKLREMLINTIKEMRTAVHDVKDAANKAIVSTEAAAVRAEKAASKSS